MKKSIISLTAIMLALAPFSAASAKPQDLDMFTNPGISGNEQQRRYWHGATFWLVNYQNYRNNRNGCSREASLYLFKQWLIRTPQRRDRPHYYVNPRDGGCHAVKWR